MSDSVTRSPRFTPGPWKQAKTAFGAICCEQGYMVARVAGRDTDDDAQANALLIAAAPDLLEALKDITAAYKSLRRREGYGDDPSDCIDFALEAIARATEAPQ